MAGFSTFFNESDDLEREIKRADNSNPLSGDVVQFDADGNLIAAEGGGGGGIENNTTNTHVPFWDGDSFEDSAISATPSTATVTGGLTVTGETSLPNGLTIDTSGNINQANSLTVTSGFGVNFNGTNGFNVNSTGNTSIGGNFSSFSGNGRTTVGLSESPTRVAGTNVTNPASGTTALGIDSNGALTTTVGGGGTTINPTDNAIPVRSDATTFVDSPITIGAGVGLTTDLADIDTNGDGNTFNALQGGGYLGTRADGITAYYDGSGVFPDPGGWVTGSVVAFAANFVTNNTDFSNEVAGNSYTITGVSPQPNLSDGATVNHSFEFTLDQAIVANISTEATPARQVAGQIVIVEAGADATTVTGDLTVTGTINSLITTTATAAGITDILNNGNNGSITSSSPTVPGFTTNNLDTIPAISFGAVQPLDSNGVGIPDGTQFSGLVVTDDNDAQIRTWTVTWQVVFDVEWFIYGDVVASNFIFDGGTETWDVAYSNQPELIVDLRTITATVPASATVTGDLAVTGTTTLAITDTGTIPQAGPFQFRIADSTDTGLDGFITFVRE